METPASDPDKYSNLSWHRVVLGKWVASQGLNRIIEESIRYKKDNPQKAMFIEGECVDYGRKRRT